MSFSTCKRLIEEGDTVILFVSVTNIYAIEVKPKIINRSGQEIDNLFQTRYGGLRVTNLIGKEFGCRITLPKGWLHVLYPTPELWTVTLPHRTQILYTPDISMVITQLEIGAGSVVCEAGTGSGSLSHALLRAIGPTGRLYTCDFHKERSQVALEEFTRHGLGDRVTVAHRDACVDGLGVEAVADAVFLDLPKPWEALPHAVNAIKADGGRICSFSPCIEQVYRTCETVRDMGLKEITTLECLSREFQVKYIRLPVLTTAKEVEAVQNSKEASESKKIKLDDQSSDKLEVTSELLIEDSTVENVKDVAVTTGFNKTIVQSKEFMSTFPQLKMPGHTGYLTFATVPPGLKRKAMVTKDLNEDTLAE